MRLFFVGDFHGDNGPASVNKALKSKLPKDTLYSIEKNKYKRIIELAIKIYRSDVVLFSGLSKINLIGLKIAKAFGKKSAYLMHGCLKMEAELNENMDRKSIEVENEVLKLSPLIICVSEFFMEWMKDNYFRYKDKFTYVNNGVEWGIMDETSQFNSNKEIKTLMTVGGGAPQKNIISVCKAIDILNNTKNMNLKLIVIGKYGKHTDEIKKYTFVDYIEHVKKEEMNLYYRKSQIFVQNSIFETFGLAVVEALLCGCTLLVSNNMGVKNIIPEMREFDIIYDTYNTRELTEKIEYLLFNSNHKRLMSNINKANTSIETTVDQLLTLLEKLDKKHE